MVLRPKIIWIEVEEIFCCFSHDYLVFLVMIILLLRESLGIWKEQLILEFFIRNLNIIGYLDSVMLIILGI